MLRPAFRNKNMYVVAQVKKKKEVEYGWSSAIVVD